MMPEIRKHLTTINRTIGRSQPIRFIIVHYTYGAVTAAGAALANCKYFAQAYRGASAHYFIDDGPVIWQSVEDKDTAWSVGAKSYRHKTARNSNTLSIEVCTKGAFTEAEVANLEWLVKKKMAEHGITAQNVIRHYDVTGKLCPAYYVDGSRWDALHRRITTTAPQERTYKVMALSTALGGSTERDREFEAKLKDLCRIYGKALFETKEAPALPEWYRGWYRLPL